MAQQMLRQRGHAVETASNGSAGLDRLAAVCGADDDFDLVLCDFQMPVRARCFRCVFV
jgi:CheY-like chemotaxis protein